jgi:hypothetical protein
MRPSFKDITLYQLCYWKATRIYGLTPEEIKDLITNPDPHIPSHHQVDPRIIKAYLTGEGVPTYLPGYWLSRYFGTLPVYLPRDRFLPSELAVPLVNAHYCQDYLIWKRRLDANIRATHYLVDHLRDPSGTVAYCQSIEAPVSITFDPTVRAAELRWWHGYLITYHSFNDLILLRGHYQNSLNYHIRTVSWHTGKSAQDIYATALTILQVGQPTIRLPPNPDFNSLSPEEKDRIYQDLHNQTPMDWYLKKQATVETATFGSEFIAARTTINQIVDLRTTLRYLGVPIREKSYVFGDNKTIIDASLTPHAKLHKRHNALSFHHVREAVASKYVTIFHLPGEYNPANILSKQWAYALVWRTMNALLFARGDTWDL